MKKLGLLLLSFLFVLTACNSSKKNLQSGNYDEIITKSVKKLIRNPDSNKDAVLLDKAYQLANDRDLETIKYLKVDGQPDNWDKILQHYESLKGRQNQLKPILPFKMNGRLINYKRVDYDVELVSAKRKAAAYFYAHAKTLLASQNKTDIRRAYQELIRTQQYANSSYTDLKDLIQEAHYRGVSRVFVKLDNRSQFNFPPEFFERILSGNISHLNSEWVQYWFKDGGEKIDFDYLVRVDLLNIQVSPDDVQNKDRMFKKKIEDGFEYVLDSRGNVKKDSTGNDIKKVKYKALQCAVVETVQHKEARLNGEMEFYSLLPEQRLLKKTPFGANNAFHHVSARAIGDVRALDDEMLHEIKIKPLPFPTDEELIFDNALRVQEAIYRILRANERYFR